MSVKSFQPINSDGLKYLKIHIKMSGLPGTVLMGPPVMWMKHPKNDQGPTPGLDIPLVRVREGSWTHLTMNRPVTARGHLNDIMRKTTKKLECPKCGSEKIFPETAFITGYKYHCENCDYVGPLVIERDVERE